MAAGLEEACHHCVLHIANNVCLICGLLASLALPLTMAFIGMKMIDDCPVQPMIPLYLLVGGVVGSLKVSLLLYDAVRMRSLLSKAEVIGDDDDDEYPWRQNAHKYYVHVILSAFLFIWFILGNYWVFSVYQPNFIQPFQRPWDFCQRSLYVFAVLVLSLSHTALLLLLCCTACLQFCSRTSTRRDYQED